MMQMRIKDICSSVTDGSHNPPQGINNSQYMMLSSKNIFDDKITFDYKNSSSYQNSHEEIGVELEMQYKKLLKKFNKKS